MRIKMLFILLAVGTVFILGIAIGLGVGLSSKTSSESSSKPHDTTPSPSASPPVQDALRIGGSLNDSYYSTKGAWNGSGIAYNWQTFSSDLEGQPQGEQNLIVYYQHYLGAIRWMRRSDDAKWLRGSEGSEDVAADAKNATPISAVHLNQNVTKLWHVFCKHRVQPAFTEPSLTSLRHRPRQPDPPALWQQSIDLVDRWPDKQREPDCLQRRSGRLALMLGRRRQFDTNEVVVRVQQHDFRRIPVPRRRRRVEMAEELGEFQRSRRCRLLHLGSQPRVHLRRVCESAESGRDILPYQDGRSPCHWLGEM